MDIDLTLVETNTRPNKLLLSANRMHDVFLHNFLLYVKILGMKQMEVLRIDVLEVVALSL